MWRMSEYKQTEINGISYLFEVQIELMEPIGLIELIELSCLVDVQHVSKLESFLCSSSRFNQVNHLS